MDGKRQDGTPDEKLVLIVDDDESVWDVLRFIVSKEGFRAERAADGEEALDKTRSLRPVLVILDLMLPKSGGYEVLRELQTDHTANIPVVIVSGRRLDRTTLAILKSEPNVREFLEKPVDPQALKNVLHSLLRAGG